MAVYEYLVVDSTSGDALEQIPLSDVTYTNGLNGAGSFSGTLSTTHEKATPDLLQTISREILVLRDGIPVFMGPIVGLTANYKQITINAVPVWWYMTKRTLELGRNYVDQDMSDIFDDIMSTVNGKFLGDIRLEKNVPFTTTGQLYSVAYEATTRKYASEAISELCQIYPGFDWMVELNVNLTTGKVDRTYQIYPGFKGVLTDQALTASNITDFQLTDDGTRVYNRVHELGAGSGNTQLIVSRSSYEPDAFYDYGESTIGWTVGGSAGVISSVGRPSPSFGVAGGDNMRRSYSHGIGSTIEFDYFHDGLGTSNVGNTDPGLVNSSGQFYFGADSTGAGIVWSPYISADGVTGAGLSYGNSWGSAASTSNHLLSNMRLAQQTWYRVQIQIVSSGLAKMFINGTEAQYYNPSTTSYDYGFPIEPLNGNYFGFDGISSAAAYGTHYFDNIVVPQPVSSYTNPGIPYIEFVSSRTDVTNLKSLQLYAQADLFLGQWPAKIYSVTYTPSTTIPFGSITPGDKVPLDIDYGFLQVDDIKRVVSIQVTVNEGGGETVQLVFNDTHA